MLFVSVLDYPLVYVYIYVSTYVNPHNRHTRDNALREIPFIKKGHATGPYKDRIKILGNVTAANVRCLLASP